MPCKNTQIEKLQIVCKVIKANNQHVVKLSDDPVKTTGNTLKIKRYLKLFKTQK